MKKVLVVFALSISLLTLSACNNSQPQEGQPEATKTENSEAREFKRYEVESGIIEYTLSGAEEGTETFYFREYGNEESRHKSAQAQIPGGLKLPAGVGLPKTEQVTLVQGDTIYTYDINTRTGTKLSKALEVFGKSGQGDDIGKMGREMLKNMGAVQKGTKEVAGHTCDVYVIEQMNTETCIYKGVTLESIATFADISTSIVATSAQFGVEIPEDKITLPDDVTITDQGDVQDLLNNLKPQQ